MNKTYRVAFALLFCILFSSVSGIRGVVYLYVSGLQAQLERGTVTIDGKTKRLNEQPKMSVKVGNQLILTNKMGYLGYLHIINSFLIFAMGLAIGFLRQSRSWLRIFIAGLILLNVGVELTDQLAYPGSQPIKLAAHASGLVLIILLTLSFWFHQRNAIRQLPYSKSENSLTT